MGKRLWFFALAASVMLLSAAESQAQENKEKKNAQSVAAQAAQAINQVPQAAAPAPPKPVYWTNSLQTSLKFSQTTLTNWAAGGVNNLTLATYIDAQANYSKNKTSWTNRLQLDYGFIYQEDKPFLMKNADRIYLESKFASKAADKMNYTAQFSLRSQFTNTFTYKTPSGYEGDSPTRKDWMDARVLNSGFFSPAYTTLAIGMEWVPNPKNRWLVANFAPLTGGFTVVMDEALRTDYGMQRREEFEDEASFPFKETLEDGTVITHGEYYRSARFQLGAQLKLDVNAKINNKFTYYSQLVLFSDYLNKPENMRVNFDTRINWTLAKNLSLALTTFLIYDDNVRIKNEKDIEKYPDGKQRVQFKEYVGIDFVYKFTKK